MRVGKKLEFVLAALVLALCAFMLEWLQFKFYMRSVSTTVYIIGLVSGFTVLGIWIGHQITRKKMPLPTFELNEKAMKNLGVTRREHAVLSAIAKGSSNKQIARDLGISPNTVKTHISNLFIKLKVDGRMKAVRAAREMQILPS